MKKCVANLVDFYVFPLRFCRRSSTALKFNWKIWWSYHL